MRDKSLELVDYWNRELKENPNLMDALESDVNNALEVIHKMYGSPAFFVPAVAWAG